MQKEIFKLFTPKNEVLKTHIKTYYLHAATEKDFHQNIIYYPNYTTTLNIYKNSKIEWSDFERTHTYDKKEGFKTLLVGKINKARGIKMFGPFEKIGIVFHPLGLNHFINIPLSKIIKEHFSFFDFFGNVWDELLVELFNAKEINDKVKVLDDFFTEHYFLFNENRLKKAVDIILNKNELIKVSDLADELNISRKTLLRLFQKHLSYSVEEYISVVKFRKALINYQNKNHPSRLTDIAYESGYYDQSDFIRHFKSRAGVNPKRLFAELQTVEKGLYWKR